VKIVDANVLLYAVDEDAAHHQQSRAWLDAALSGGAVVGFSWMALLAFVRLSTKAGLFPTPLTAAQAMDRVDAWLDAPSAVLATPTLDHRRIVRSLLDSAGATGNLVNDAHLAALAIEHRGSVVSYDSDFARFPGVRWERPA
jgi:uncharacterized protein